MPSFIHFMRSIFHLVFISWSRPFLHYYWYINTAYAADISRHADRPLYWYVQNRDYAANPIADAATPLARQWVRLFIIIFIRRVYHSFRRHFTLRLSLLLHYFFSAFTLFMSFETYFSFLGHYRATPFHFTTCHAVSFLPSLSFRCFHYFIVTFRYFSSRHIPVLACLLHATYYKDMFAVAFLPAELESSDGR